MPLKSCCFPQVKIWFQNRRVKYKKEEGSQPKEKCSCLRTCTNKDKTSGESLPPCTGTTKDTTEPIITAKPGQTTLISNVIKREDESKESLVEGGEKTSRNKRLATLGNSPPVLPDVARKDERRNSCSEKTSSDSETENESEDATGHIDVV